MDQGSQQLGHLPQTSRRSGESPQVKKPQQPVVAPIQPRNPTQAAYLQALEASDMVLGVGPAGTGKTYLAVIFAAQAFLSGLYDRIILTRATVPVAGENLGFLPGDLDEKMGPWVAEILGILEEVLGKQKLAQHRSKGDIQVIPFAYMRGRTFNNALILCDEMQNATISQVKTLVTRIGENSKMLMNGDLGQSDLRGENGLSRLLQMVKDRQLPVPVVSFSDRDVVRSHLCQMWVSAFNEPPSALTTARQGI